MKVNPKPEYNVGDKVLCTFLFNYPSENWVDHLCEVIELHISSAITGCRYTIKSLVDLDSDIKSYMTPETLKSATQKIREDKLFYLLDEIK